MLRSVGDVDIQLLGIGRNGHIGFNEPDNCFSKGTHCVNLTESTIEANKRFFASEDEVPRRAYSMGIHTIMTAKKCWSLPAARTRRGLSVNPASVR